MKFFYLLALLFSFASCNLQKEAKKEEVTIYYFIRHAEKDTSNPEDHDPLLIPVGEERAEKWAQVFKDIQFDLVYSSSYKRTMATAKPIAKAQNLQIQTYNTEKLNDEEFRKETKGKTVLVVGHSNLNPEWVNYIIEEEKYEDIDEKDSGSLFIVWVHPNGQKTSQVLHID